MNRAPSWHSLGARPSRRLVAPEHMACPRVASWLRRLLLFDLPPSLALFYFLNSCVQSLPLTANQASAAHSTRGPTRTAAPPLSPPPVPSHPVPSRGPSPPFPLTSNQGWLLEDLAMPQPTVNLYYAVTFMPWSMVRVRVRANPNPDPDPNPNPSQVTFMPWSLKPLYALLADRLPLCGYHF